MITHILKGGETTDSIQGRIVRQVECPEAYRIMKEMERRKQDDEQEIGDQVHDRDL